MTAEDDCPLCAKQRGVGPFVCPVIFSDDLVVVTHRATGSVGYVFIETTRHVAYVHQLTEAEAAAVGRIRTRVAAALAAELPIDYVFAMVAGTGVAHFHEHVFVRHVGTPADLPWGQPWSDAPTGDIEALVGKLAARLLG
ncbi:MAG TPA: HIT domain-containing protein [Microlunatus sp.]